MRNINLTKKTSIIKHKHLSLHVKMGEEILAFVNVEIEK